MMEVEVQIVLTKVNFDTELYVEIVDVVWLSSNKELLIVGLGR